MPMVHSPMPMDLDGPPPDLVYWAMFLSRSTRNWMPSSWPYFWMTVLMISSAVEEVL